MSDKWFVLLLTVVLGAVLIEQELSNQREHELKVLQCEASHDQ